MNTIDNENIAEELHDFIARSAKTRQIIETVMQSRLTRVEATFDNAKWLKKFIGFADSGRHLGWLETELEWLETDGLEGVPQHIVDHAISLAKQAIAKEAPSLV